MNAILGIKLDKIKQINLPLKSINQSINQSADADFYKGSIQVLFHL